MGFCTEIIHAGWTRELLESLFDAVTDLRRSLQRINSDLLIRRGRSKDVILALAHEVCRRSTLELPCDNLKAVTSIGYL